MNRTERKQRYQRARERKARDRRILSNFMPPEGVPIRLEVASLGMRVAAQITDVLLCLAGVLAFVVLLVLGVEAHEDLVGSLAALLFFFLRAPYYILTELLWNGQTLGKRLTRLRVVSMDGRSLSAHAVVVRNLMKEMEVFMPGTLLFVAGDLGAFWVLVTLVWVGILLAVPLFNRRRQRIGDMIAGTVVIHQPQAILLPDIAKASRGPRFAFLPHQLDHYGDYELQTLEKVLRVVPPLLPVEGRRRHDENLTAISDRIGARIGWTEKIGPEEARAFLEAFYAAQRAFLEQRRLYGEARQDKFHKEDRA